MSGTLETLARREVMDIIEREFYRCASGPSPGDEDILCLVFDPAKMRLLVRHEWDTSKHSGVDELEIAEFLMQVGAASVALKGILFGRVTADA